jgi:hypothetical protein
MGRRTFSERILPNMLALQLGAPKMAIIKNRYLWRVEGLETKKTQNRRLHIIFCNTATILGVLLLCIISLRQVIAATSIMVTKMPWWVDFMLFWVIWLIAGLTALFVKVNSVAGFYHRYITTSYKLKQYYSEGWKFVSDMGKYGALGTKDEKFRRFCARIERIEKSPIGTQSAATTEDTITPQSLDSDIAAASTVILEDEIVIPPITLTSPSNIVSRLVLGALTPRFGLDQISPRTEIPEIDSFTDL